MCIWSSRIFTVSSRASASLCGTLSPMLWKGFGSTTGERGARLAFFLLPCFFRLTINPSSSSGNSSSSGLIGLDMVNDNADIAFNARRARSTARWQSLRWSAGYESAQKYSDNLASTFEAIDLENWEAEMGNVSSSLCLTTFTPFKDSPALC